MFVVDPPSFPVDSQLYSAHPRVAKDYFTVSDIGEEKLEYGAILSGLYV